MFRTPLCPSSGASQLHMQSLVPCGAWLVVSSSSAVLQHSRTGGHNEPSTTRDQRLHAQLRSSWWWARWCPEHVERNNVNKILRIFKKQSTSGWHFIQVIIYDVRNHEPEIYCRQFYELDRPRGLVVRVSDYWSWGPGFDSRLYRGNFS